MLKRAFSKSPFEKLAEIRNVMKTQLLRDLADWDGRMVKQFQGPVHSQLVDIFDGGGGIDRFEQPDKVGRSDIRHFR